MKRAFRNILYFWLALFLFSLWYKFFGKSEFEKAISVGNESSSENGVEENPSSALGGKDVSRSVLPPRFIQASHRLQNDPNDRDQLSEEAKVLESFKIPEQTAMNALFTLIQSCGSIANQGFMPTGLNVDVVNGLLGDNYRKIAYLPQSHPRISDYGEFVDGWKTPYEFHFLSSKKVEIRSAGPDLEMYSDDDVLLEVE